MVRRSISAAGAALVAALVLGAVARALMRLVTAAAGHPPSFSWPGTISILAIFFLAVLPGCLVAAFATRRRRLVLGIGALLLCVPATGVAAEEIGSTETFGVAQWLGVVLAGVGVYATIFALPAVCLRLVDATVPRRRLPSPRRPAEGLLPSDTKSRSARPSARP